MQEFYINKKSLLPTLRMEIVNDGRNDFTKFNDSIQNANVTFSMKNFENDVYTILNAPVEILMSDNGACEEKYILVYKWKMRDVKESGIFIGSFNIDFNGEIKQNGVEYPQGNLIVPIYEDLKIYIK